MSEPNKDGTDMMMAMLMGLSGPRASRAWTEAQEIQATSFLTLAEHWINETATEIVRVKGENAHLKAEVDNLRKNADISPSQSPHEIERLCAWGRGLESDLSHARVEISFLKAEVERLTKAGDAMASSIQFNEEMAQDYNGPTIVHQCVQRWNAAKEGKPSV